MDALPQLLHKLYVPAYISVTALCSSYNCKLKMIAAASNRSDEIAQLISGPEAAVGTLIHRIIEHVARKGDAYAEDVFQKEYKNMVAELQADPRRAHYAELTSTRSTREWARLKAWVTAIGVRQKERAAKNEITKYQQSSTRVVYGAEVVLKSRKLRLVGKVDRIRRLSPSFYEIRDYKTGASFNARGEIKEEIYLQLCMYGQLLLTRMPGINVRLVVDDGKDRVIEYGKSEQKKSIEFHKQVMDKIPQAGRAEVSTLANPGSSCWKCHIRHVCSEYRVVAPVWWRRYPAGIDRIPNDIWGVVTEVDQGVLSSVVLRDDAGRRVRIDGIDGRHRISSVHIGQRLWFFDLESTGATRGFDGTRYHPRSFHELSRDSLERRSWVMSVFKDSSEFH